MAGYPQVPPIPRDGKWPHGTYWCGCDDCRCPVTGKIAPPPYGCGCDRCEP